MEALECIKTRRSIRRFEEKAIEKETIEELITLTTMAPTWKNVQANRFVVVLDPEKKAKIAEESCTAYANNQKIINGAAALVIVTTVNGRSGFERDGSFSTSKGTHWQSFDAGIATENLCLAAHAMGLGTVIMGIYDEDKVIETAEIPEGELVSALVAIGYPAEEPVAPKRKELEKVLSYR